MNHKDEQSTKKEKNETELKADIKEIPIITESENNDTHKDEFFDNEESILDFIIEKKNSIDKK